jgi:hypothetical protein
MPRTDFASRIKMYKNRITKWGLDRKYKKRDTSAARKTRQVAMTRSDQRSRRPLLIDIPNSPGMPVTRGESGGRSTSTEPESAIATAIHQFPTAAPSPSAGGMSPILVQIYSKGLLPPRTRTLAELVEQSPLTPDLAVQSPTIPETVSSFDQIRSEIFDYSWTSFESKAWISEGIDSYCRSAKARPGVRDVISSFKTV